MHRRAQTSIRWLIVLVVLGAAAAGGVLVYLWLRPVVTVTEAVEAPVVQAFYSTGTVSPAREFIVKSNTAGILSEMFVDKGTAVKKGQALGAVTDPALTFRGRRARAELDERVKRADPATSPVLREFDARIRAATELLEIATRERERVQDVLSRNAASQTDLDRAIDRETEVRSQLEGLRAQRAAKQLELAKDVEVAQAGLDVAEWELQQQTLRSPIDGVVLDWPVSQGTRLAVNDPVLRVADVRPANLVMRAAVDEEDVTKVRPGQLVRMALYSFEGQVMAGHVARIYDQADAERRTFEVDVSLDGAQSLGLMPGMTGELAFVIDSREKAIVVPAQAVQSGAIYAVRDGKLAKLDARLGLRSVERVEVTSGIFPGERVVITPVGDLKPGQSVRTTYIAPAEAAGLNKPAIEESSFKGF